MSKDIGFCSITEDLCKKDGKCEDCSLKHIHENIEHYAKLHEENRLIELPCKVGDTVWEVVPLPLLPDEIEVVYVICKTEFGLNDLDLFGNEIFLTKEEAEAKLAELQGNDGI